MGNNYFSKYLATHFSEIIADRIGYAGWRQGANKGCISPRTQVSSSKPLSPIDISRERRWIINRAESSDFGFPRSTMKYATVLEGSFDPASGGERTSVKMELTPPPPKSPGWESTLNYSRRSFGRMSFHVREGLTYPRAPFRVLRNKRNCLETDKRERYFHMDYYARLHLKFVIIYYSANCAYLYQRDKIISNQTSFGWNRFKSITAKPRLISVLRERQSGPHFTILMMASLLDRSAATLIK